ncbi:hypothetical protein V9T40_009969 [Parthenolecanium corni]|uniref:Uncharacterized protein n=1 Tax=Parthenolecanium corni TaxID=536013 RepID=A0AAN9TYW7_9HEMI
MVSFPDCQLQRREVVSISMLSTRGHHRRISVADYPKSRPFFALRDTEGESDNIDIGKLPHCALAPVTKRFSAGCWTLGGILSQPCLHKYLPRVAGHEIKTGNDVSDHLWRHTLKLTLLLFAGSQYLKTPTVAEFDTVCKSFQQSVM